MFTKVDDVLIANGTSRKASLIDVATGKAVTGDTVAAMIILKDAKDNIIERSNIIQKAAKPRFVTGVHAEPIQSTTTIDFTNAVDAEGSSLLVIGHRYVLRIVYKDLYEAPGQFTHTYEVVATTDSAEDLINAFVAKINKHANRRVNASANGKKLILTAMAKDDNEGVHSLNEYSIVSMAVTLYFTIPGALLANQPEKVPGITIDTVEGNPGVGYWKQVRDLELRAMGYKGHVFTGAYPTVEQDRKVEIDGQYNYLMVEFDNLYLSPDNQYIKTTPLRIQLFDSIALDSDAGTDELSTLIKALGTFGAVEQLSEKAKITVPAEEKP